MATLYLTANLIKTVFLKRKSIFVMVLVCLLLVNVAVLYSADMLYKIAYSSAGSYYVLSFSDAAYETLAPDFEVFDSSGFFNVTVYFEEGETLILKGETPIITNGRMPTSDSEILAAGGLGFDLGEQVELYGKTFTICGLANVSGTFVFEKNAVPASAKVTRIDVASLNLTKSTLKSLQKSFPSAEITKANPVSLRRDILSNLLSILLVGVDFLAVGGLVLCVVYLLTSAEDVLKVYKIQGVTDSRAADVCVFFLLGIMLASAVIGGAIYKILEVLIFAKSGAGLSIAKYMLTFSDILLVNLLLLAAVMIVYLPFLASTAKKKIEVRENV